MKILSVKPLGLRRTFSPEMASPRHNYITASSGAVHANSHAVAYCLVAHRCLWLKAHFPAEWWAAVMSGCHPKKLARYMGVAKGENVEFATMNVDRLSVKFTVTGKVVNPGLIGLKRVGITAAELFQFDGKRDKPYANIDEFVEAHPKSKIVLERLIKLGSFDHLHPNRKALWHWYLYKYGSGSEATQLRRNIKAALLERDGWNDFKVAEERERQWHEYLKLYPNRTKEPAKISNWKPTPRDDRESVLSLLADDHYTDAQILDFEKEFLGYYLSNPLARYKHHPNCTIGRAKEMRRSTVHVVVVGVEYGKTKQDKVMCRMTISDGANEAMVLLWEEECETYAPLLQLAEQMVQREVKSDGVKRVEVGVGANVVWDAERRTFTLQRRKPGSVSLWALGAIDAT